VLAVVSTYLHWMVASMTISLSSLPSSADFAQRTPHVVMEGVSAFSMLQYPLICESGIT
jgi:xanthine/uracil permease